MVGDIFERGDLAFPKSLPGFQKLFPNDAACAAYLEQTRWEKGFVCALASSCTRPFFSTAEIGSARSTPPRAQYEASAMGITPDDLAELMQTS